MTKHSILWALAFGFLALSFLAGCSKQEPAPAPLTAREQRGERLYRAACAQCHRADSEAPLNGPGMKGIYSRKFMPSGAPANDERIREVIKMGRRLMPPFKDTLDDSQINDIMAYMKRL